MQRYSLTVQIPDASDSDLKVKITISLQHNCLADRNARLQIALHRSNLIMHARSSYRHTGMPDKHMHSAVHMKTAAFI